MDEYYWETVDIMQLLVPHLLIEAHIFINTGASIYFGSVALMQNHTVTLQTVCTIIFSLYNRSEALAVSTVFKQSMTPLPSAVNTWVTKRRCVWSAVG